jgi:hypothetical protein
MHVRVLVGRRIKIIESKLSGIRIVYQNEVAITIPKSPNTLTISYPITNIIG